LNNALTKNPVDFLQELGENCIAIFSLNYRRKSKVETFDFQREVI